MRRLLALTTALLWTSSAAAAELNGYANSRTQYSRSRLDGLLSTADLPQWQQVVELNAQLKQPYLERAFVFGDVSAFLVGAGNYRQLDERGTEVVVRDHDTASSRPSFSLNELYVSHEVVPELNVLVGKKRLVWGPGFAANPMDLLNPAKDPTDPSLQRVGTYMARVEIPLETTAFSFVFAPDVTDQVNGLPRRLLYYPKWNQVDEEPHYLLAARAYGLMNDADLNLVVYYSNRFHDAFEDKLRWGMSFSKVYDAVEVHLEALFQQGSARQYPNSACLRDRAAALGCARSGTPLLDTSRVDDHDLFGRALFGLRYQGEDDLLISAEYLFQSDGYTPSQFQDVVNALALVKEAARLGLPTTGTGLFGDSEAGSTRFSFEPLGQHYLFLTLQKQKIKDDFTLNLVLLSSLQDLSGMFAPSLAWSATDWLTLTASAFLPYAGPDVLAATRADDGTKVHEYTLLPMKYRAMLEVRAFY